MPTDAIQEWLRKPYPPSIHQTYDENNEEGGDDKQQQRHQSDEVNESGGR